MLDDEDVEEGEEVSDEEVQLAFDLLDDLQEYKDWSFICPYCRDTVFPIMTEVCLDKDKEEHGLSFEDNVECGYLSIINPKIHFEKLCPTCTEEIYSAISNFIKGE